jgi:hypothetical protein
MEAVGSPETFGTNLLNCTELHTGSILAHQVFIVKAKRLMLFGIAVVCFIGNVECRYWSVNSRCVLQRGSGLTER